MPVPYKDVSASALCLNLHWGPVDISTLQPIDRTGLALSIGGVALKIEIGILGASHFMALAAVGGEDLLTEIVACAEVHADGQRLFFGPLGIDGRIGPLNQTILGGALTYTFSAWTERWSGQASDAVRKLTSDIEHANVGASRLSAGLKYEFLSSPGKQTDQMAVTLVFLESAPDLGIHLRTLHSYPNDGAVVMTESALKEGGRK